MLIDATLQAPDAAAGAAERANSWRTRATIWEELGLPALTVQSPWHGYSLGDWTEAWETFARRAVAGDWEVTGRETFARQRTGVAPETPTKEGSAKMGE